MRRSRESVLLPILVALGIVAWFVVRAASEGDEARVRVGREDAALAVLQQIATAQGAYHQARGRYGWLEDLRAAGLLDGVTWFEGGADLAAVVPDYRIDVVLPATTSAAQLTALAPRAAARASERLARRHFAVVARPWGDASGGWRTWYLDERGRIYVNEGVSDPVTRVQPPLPSALVPENGGTDPAGLRWWPLDDLPER